MLYGVRTELQKQLHAQGEQVRLYLPFGRDWWPYAVRRVGESPRNAALLARVGERIGQCCRRVPAAFLVRLCGAGALAPLSSPSTLRSSSISGQ